MTTFSLIISLLVIGFIPFCLGWGAGYAKGRRDGRNRGVQ